MLRVLACLQKRYLGLNTIVALHNFFDSEPVEMRQTRAPPTEDALVPFVSPCSLPFNPLAFKPVKLSDSPAPLQIDNNLQKPPTHIHASEFCKAP